MAAKVHYIGKIGIPLEILIKPGKLTPEEYAVIKTHTIIGYNILSRINWDYPLADIVVQHHERLDGTGYPYSLNKNQLLLESKIIAVADVTHALISHRPYRPSKGKDYTIKILKEQRGEWLYDDAVDAAIEYISTLHI
jgi:HD-GYP domain-containing protein (c-di-GMP phosphodiesterase class II)